MRPPPFVARSLVRLAAGGLALLAVVWAGGRGLEQRRFGGDEAAGRARVEALVAEVVRDIEASLQQTIDAATVSPEDLLAASQGDPAAERRLFDRLAEAARDRGPVVSATIYGTELTPIAWTGRPVELPDARVMGPVSAFLAPDAQGLRLVRVQPLQDHADPTRRSGAVVVQAALARANVDGPPDDYVLRTDLARVSVRPLFEGGGDAAPDEFLMRTGAGQVLASVSLPATSLALERSAFHRRVSGALLVLTAVILLLGTGPLLDWRRVTRQCPTGVLVTMVVAAMLVVARWLVGLGVTAADVLGDALLTPDLLSAWPRLGSLFFASALHFLASSLLVAALVALAASSLELWRVARRRGGRPLSPAPSGFAALVLVQLVAGVVVTLALVGYGAFIRFGVAAVPTDILHFGLRPWDWHRLSVLIGIIALNAGVAAACAVILRLALGPWALGSMSRGVRAVAALAWLSAPAAVLASGAAADWAPTVPTLLAAAFVGAVAWRAARIRAGMRNASQAARLLMLVLGLVLPSLVFYPSMVDAAGRARRRLVETRFAPEVLEQRRTLQGRLAGAMADIDRMPGLADLVRASDPALQGAPPVDAAFLVWSQTELARQRLTSSVELYAATGAIASRFALNLPDITGVQTATD
ncbi:MAG: hypothetical protein OEW19_04290, partial [Acidobacteriota bacterium]|nr:hypothetical protein [Acidobacteriota bacterium]